MAYYIENVLNGAVLSAKRPIINEYFLSSYMMAIYDGCEFGCPYCDGWSYHSRPFNETVRVPVNLPDRLEEELEHIDRGDVIAITSLTDPYQPAENMYRMTRQVLRIFADRGQPCVLMTKSHTVVEDLVLLERINAQSLAMVVFSVLTVDPNLSEKLEDKSSVPALRLEAIAALRRAGIPVGVAMIPIVPYVTDTDMQLNNTLRAIAAAGANFVFWEYLHIPDDRHRSRVNDMLARIGRYPPSYYRDLYGNRVAVDDMYRHERDLAVLSRCDHMGLSVRAPHRIYAGKLRPANEAALLLRHTAYFDTLQNRTHMAAQGRALADALYRGTATEEMIAASPLSIQVREIMRRATLDEAR
ncbi:MAG: radical SAM protein [Chloroflexi bacterium]|jgi:DNA repair photolyase|nr:radical SAM protein [Chloroflexota bacterium]